MQSYIWYTYRSYANWMHTFHALCILRMRKLGLCRTLSITEPSRNESVCSAESTFSRWLSASILSGVSQPLSEFTITLSRCSWSNPSTLLCKLNGMTTWTNGHKESSSFLLNHFHENEIECQLKPICFMFCTQFWNWI